jgi:hypothetical protein
MVSRKPDAVCFHCGTILEQCDLEYVDYMNMTENERNDYKQNFKNRLTTYNEKLVQVHPANNKGACL